MLQMHAEVDSYGNSGYLSTQVTTHRCLCDVTPVLKFTHCDSLTYVACRRSTRTPCLIQIIWLFVNIWRQES